MPTKASHQRVRDAFGEEGAGVLEEYIRALIAENAVGRDEYREVLSRLDVVESRLDGVEREVQTLRSEMREGFRSVNDRFDRMQQQFDQRLDQMSGQFDQRLDQTSGQFGKRLDQVDQRLDKMMRWTVGTIALFGTLITVLLAIAEFA